MVKSLFWDFYETDACRKAKSRLENVLSKVINRWLIIIKLWKQGAHQGHWWQNRGLWYKGEVWLETGQRECEAGCVSKANCIPQCCQSRAETDKADTVGGLGKGIGVAVLA